MSGNSDIVERHRRIQSAQIASKPRRWTTALAGLGGMIVIGLVGLQLVMFATSSSTTRMEPVQDSTLRLAPTTVAQQRAEDVASTGSTMPMVLQGPSFGTELSWWTWLYTTGISLAAGLIVYTALRKLLRMSSDDHGDQGFDHSTNRRTAHRIDDVAEERRHHGGPIRN